MSKQLKESIKNTLDYWVIKAKRNKSRRTTIKSSSLMSLHSQIMHLLEYHGSDEC